MKSILTLGPVRFVLDMADLYFSKRVARTAAELAYFLVLSFFPFLICVNAFIGLLDLDAAAIVAGAHPFLPNAALDILTDYLAYIGGNQSWALLAAGITMTLFSASAAFRALMNIMDDLFERRGYTGVRQIIASVLFSVLLLITVYASIIVVLTGEWLFRLIQDFFRLDTQILPWDWQWLRFFMLFALMFTLVLIVYRMSAPRGGPRPPLVGGRGPGLPGPGGGQYPLLLVHQPVVPVFAGVRLPGVGDYPSGVAVSVRQHPHSGQRVQLRPLPPQAETLTPGSKGGHPWRPSPLSSCRARATTSSCWTTAASA